MNDHRRLIIGWIFVVSFLVISSVVYFYRQSRLEVPTIQFERSFEHHRDRIGLIGDSWVADDRFKPFLLEACSRVGLSVEITSVGYRGADSGRIRSELFRFDQTTGQHLGLLSDSRIGTVIVLAGVNDLLEHRGAFHYSRSIRSIVHELKRVGIATIVVEIPRFGLNIEPRLTNGEYLLRLVRRWTIEGHLNDPIGDYRQALRDRLRDADRGLVFLINPDSAIPDYRTSQECFSNPYHLNDEGNRRLAGCITPTLLQLLSADRNE